MNGNYILPLFPLLPVSGIIITVFFKYIIKKDISNITVPFFTLLQIAFGVVIFALGRELHATIRVSNFTTSIRLSFSPERMWVLAAFIVPALFASTKIGKTGTPSLRTVFLFYLTASSGVLVTADIFNFFVFYELMIMTAYVLISVEGKVYASIKYMFVGALSSVFFLTGIIFVYASGIPFSFESVADLSIVPEANGLLIISFFFIAFCIKSAMFPASPWLPTCHAAGNGTVSAFLSSFTVVSGFFGMYYLVLLPAQSIGHVEVFSLLRFFSLLTMCTSAVFIFFDTDIKRAIAGSTAYIAGFIGFLFSTGNTEIAWIYIFVHAVYKSILFHATDDLEKYPLLLRGKLLPFIIMGITLLFAAGIFPTVPHVLKQSAHLGAPWIYGITYGSAAVLLGGFLKFSVQTTGSGDAAGKMKKVNPWTYIIGLLLIPGLYVLLVYPGFGITAAGFTPISRFFTGKPWGYIIEGAIIPAAIVLGRVVFPKITGLANLDSRYLFRNLSIELFGLLILFGIVFVYLEALPLF